MAVFCPFEMVHVKTIVGRKWKLLSCRFWANILKYVLEVIIWIIKYFHSFSLRSYIIHKPRACDRHDDVKRWKNTFVALVSNLLRIVDKSNNLTLFVPLQDCRIILINSIAESSWQPRYRCWHDDSTKVICHLQSNKLQLKTLTCMI